jgi:hypothetical protein
MRKPDWLKVEDPDTENHRWEGLQSNAMLDFLIGMISRNDSVRPCGPSES